MTLTGLIAQYGYIAVFAGTLIEGETVLLLAGFAAHQGYLSLPWVITIALCGGVLGDQICFLLGRRYSAALLRRFPGLAPSVRRVDRLLLRYNAWLIVCMRFMYGLRIAGPLAIGMSRLPPQRFLAFNLLGAAIWAPLLAGAGFLFGHTLDLLFADLRRFEEAILLLIAASAAAIGLRRHLRRR